MLKTIINPCFTDCFASCKFPVPGGAVFLIFKKLKIKR